MNNLFLKNFKYLDLQFAAQKVDLRSVWNARAPRISTFRRFFAIFNDLNIP